MNKPLRVLHFAHGISSYNNSLIELARRLADAGMSLCVVSHIDLSDVLQSAPCDFVYLSKFDELVARQRTERSTLRGGIFPSRIYRNFKASHRYRTESLQSDEVQGVLANWQPDLLLIDMECHVAVLQTRQSAVPTLLCSRWFSVFKSPDLPPMHTDLLPPENLKQRWLVRWAWLKLALYKHRVDIAHRLSRRRFRAVSYDSHNRFDLAAVARKCGLELASVTETDHWLIPHVYKDLPVMSLVADSMEFDESLDPRMHYVGAMVGQNTAVSARTKPALVQLNHFLNDRKSKENPLVYCSFSTFWAAEGANIESLIELFSKRTDLDLVMGLGGTTLPEYTLSENILLLEFAPQLEVIRSADVVITHGGISSINEALRNGVPLLGVSGQHLDQNGCLARVLHHGLGVLCQSGFTQPHEIIASVDYLLSDAASGIRANIEQLKSQLIAYEQDNCAVKLIQDIAGYANHS